MTESVAEFLFTVGKAFLGSGHPITIPQAYRTGVHRATGWVQNSAHAVSITNCDGSEVEGSVRHSENNGGAYLQLNSSDPAVAAGLTLGQTIRVEISKGPLGVQVELES